MTYYRPWAEVRAFRDDIAKGDTHSWEDVSRHGSAWLQCEFCGCDWSAVYGGGPDPLENALTVMPDCPKRAEVLARRESARIATERAEWEQVKGRRAREQYLEETYG